jgi:hypothetical protein
MPEEKMTMTLDDVSCLLHLPNEGRPLDHQPHKRLDGVDLMVKLLGSNPADAAEEVHITKGANAMTTYLKAHFKTLMDRIA